MITNVVKMADANHRNITRIRSRGKRHACFLTITAFKREKSSKPYRFKSLQQGGGGSSAYLKENHIGLCTEEERQKR